MLATSFLDSIGVALGLWSYTVKSAPLIPPFVTFDLCQIPIANMFWIQLLPRLNPVIKSLILATGASFISQPMAVILGIYNPKVWHHYYSFPIVVLLYLIADYLYKQFQAEEVQND
ncbi:MAG TPA: CBO0543 family protein [Desulfosporosinus sp.]|nr:CBO0543 family protein [Desulfosporosinus sp.]